MLESLSCKSCLAPLQPDDGHDLCPACLGVDHLREGLSGHPCMNCTIMPRSVRSARLAAFVDPEGGLSGPQSDHHRWSSRLGGSARDDALSVAASDSQFQEIEDHAENSGSLFGERLKTASRLQRLFPVPPPIQTERVRGVALQFRPYARHWRVYI
ncbi:hypothetical protein WMY93_020829 [Mugilogobius chulae]|uniref:Uncharacterized protein n=1 Tax=Mugilogobius chulae TaxID=88201 RepID=A0AAW0NJ03_9GOBI